MFERNAARRALMSVLVAGGSLGVTLTAAAQETASDSSATDLPPLQVDATAKKKKAKVTPTSQPAVPASAPETDLLAPETADGNDNSGAGAVAKAQSASASSTVVSRQRIDDSGLSSVEEATRLAPNVRFSSIGAPRFTINTVRGVGNTIADNYFNSPIGIYVDGVQISNAEFNRSLGDARSVELLRGPQGTLFGHNSLGGVISITSREPTQDPVGEVTATVGNNGQRGGSAFLSGPLVGDAVSGRAFFEYVERDGFTDYENFKGSIDDLESYVGSGSLRFAPSRAFTATLRGSIEHVDAGGYAYMPFDAYKRRVADIIPPNEDVRDTRSVSANLRYDFGGIVLTSITAARDYEVSSDQDLGYNWNLAAMGGGRATTDEAGRQFSQELRLTGGEGSAFQWLAGAFYLTERHDFDYLFDVPAFGGATLLGSDYERREIAAYGEGTLRVTRGLELTAGVRVSEEYHDWESSYGLAADDSFTMVTPKFAVAYRFDTDRQVYVSATRGARSGGFDRIGSTNVAYDAEYLWSYEVGLKSEWMQRSLTFNAAAFYIDWTDMQVKQLVAPNVIQTTNAGAAHSKGFELEASWRPATGLELSGFLGVTHGEYDDYISGLGADLAGNKLINTPEMTAGLSGQYRWPVGAFGLYGVAHVDYIYTGTHYFDPENVLKQEGYGLVNARLGIENERFSAALFAKNLFDQDYRTFGYRDYAGTFLSTEVAAAGPSRLIGVTVGVKF